MEQIFFLICIYFVTCLFIYFWLCCVFAAVQDFSLVAASGGFALVAVHVFSLPWLLSLQALGMQPQSLWHVNLLLLGK